MRRRPLITFSFSGPYLSWMRMKPCGPSVTRSKLTTKPSSTRICAIACLGRDAGISTVLWLAIFALRMRVSISAMGSVTADMPSPLPRRLGHAGNNAFVRVLAEADAAHSEATQVTARTPADAATVIVAHLELGPALLLDYHARFRH